MIVSTLSSLACYDAAVEEQLADFGRWLENEIDKRDWKQADFAQEGNFKPQNVSRWIKGAAQPSYRSARQIARTLRVSEDEVLERSGHKQAGTSITLPPSPVDHLRSLVHQLPVAIPVYDSPESAGKGVVGLQQYIYLPPDGDVRNDWYGLPVHGDRMFPLLLSGDTVFISPSSTPEPGDMVVLDLDREKGLVTWLRRKRNGELWLVPEQGDAIRLGEERVRFVGVVTRMWRNVRRPRKVSWKDDPASW